MQSVFLSFHFDPQDKALARQVSELLESHLVRPVTGENLGGAALTPAVMTRIEACDALVALMTKFGPHPSGQEFATYPWIINEHDHARAHKKPCLILRESGVKLDGAYANHEYADLDRGDLAPALLKLSATIGQWRRDLGRQVKLRLLPNAVLDKLVAGGGEAACEYRWILGPKSSPWQVSTVFPEEGGAYFAYVNAPDDSQLQVRAKVGKALVVSSVKSQYVQVELKKEKP